MNWALVCRPSIQHVYKETVTLYEYLRKKDQTVFLEATLGKLLHQKGTPLEKMKADVFVTVGGDGTVLLTLHHTDKPLLAVNAGGVGFLSEVEPKYAPSAIDRILDGDYRIEERAKLASWLEKKRLSDATNEVTLQTAKIAKLIKFRLEIDGEVCDTIRGDGIIVATSTGSTGYSLSVGGPILHPAVEGVVISPIAPFRLAARPLVVPLQSEIRLTQLERHREGEGAEAKVVVDGGPALDVGYGQSVTVKASERKARLIRFNGGFYDRVRTKLTR